MKRIVTIFFLTCALSFAGEGTPWTPFPLDATNTVFDRRIITNLVLACNERAAVVVGVSPINTTIFEGFTTRAKLKIIDDKIAELIPHFIDRSFTNYLAGDWVYNGWYRKTNSVTGEFNFDFGNVTQKLPRLNMPSGFSNAVPKIGRVIWPLYSWWGQITNYGGYSDPDSGLYRCEAWYTLVPAKSIVSTVAEWRYIATYTEVPDPTPPPNNTNPPTITTNAFWADARLNTIPDDPLNETNFVNSALPHRPFPYQGRYYDYPNPDIGLPFVQWFSKNSSITPTPSGYLTEAMIYENLERQSVLTNSGPMIEINWPFKGGASIRTTNMFLQIADFRASYSQGTINGLPTVPAPEIGDYIRIWYDESALTTYSGPEPYTGIDRDYANILWKECLNERYRILNAMTWTTPELSGGTYYWACQTSAVLSCDQPFGYAGWPAITNPFPINAFIGQFNDCPPPNDYTLPTWGVFPGWIERTGTVFSVTNECPIDSSLLGQNPRSIYDISGSVDFSSSYYMYCGIPTNYFYDPLNTNYDLDIDFVWSIDYVNRAITDTTKFEEDFAESKPVATVSSTISNLAYAVDFYFFGTNSTLSGIDDPEWVPLKRQTVSASNNALSVTGLTVKASMEPWIFNFPASATSHITQPTCPATIMQDCRTNTSTFTVSRASTYFCETQACMITNATFDYWQLTGALTNDIPDGTRTNRFETRNYRTVYSPISNWTSTGEAVACYYRVTNFSFSSPEVSFIFFASNPPPSFNPPYADTISSFTLGPWSNLQSIVGYPPSNGPTRIVDGNTNGTAILGDLFLTLQNYDSFQNSTVSYTNNLLYDFYNQIPILDQTVSELNTNHTERFQREVIWGDYYPTNKSYDVFQAQYLSSITYSNTFTNSIIQAWEPLIRWDVSGGLKYVTP